jgi:hypothetical protein
MHFQVKNIFEKQPQLKILYMFFVVHKSQL